MAAAVIIAFINIILFALLAKSIYSAIRYQKGLMFKIYSGIKKLLSPIYKIATKTPVRKYLSLMVVFSIVVIYTLQQKGIIGLHLLG